MSFSHKNVSAGLLICLYNPIHNKPYFNLSIRLSLFSWSSLSFQSFKTFSSRTPKSTFDISTPSSGYPRLTVEPGQAEPHCHCCPRHGQGHGPISRRPRGHSQWKSASPRAWRLHSLCGARQHKAGASPSSWWQKPHFWILAEEQSWWNAPHLYWGEHKKKGILFYFLQA